jgi:hypothetical protein
MRQFLEGTDTAFSDLERKARAACVVFANQEMPAGTLPSRARIGFEVDPATGEALLLVDRNLTYTGESRSIRGWLTSGQKRFQNFDAMRRWIQHDLRAGYQPKQIHAGATPAVRPVEPTANPAQLTDLTAIRQQVSERDSAAVLDERELFEQLSTLVRGQDHALRRLTRRVCHHAARRQPRRPATIFAIGPSGVGKTKAAEALAASLRVTPNLHAGYGYLRLDMSEYQERHRVSQLLGAPQGYVGYGEGAQLVDALLANPRTVVLFDEIEKAHPDILRTLMNAMDAGRLSTPASPAGRGREVDCRRAIFIFTSNLDATAILKSLGEKEAFADYHTVDTLCRAHLRRAGLAPEIIGRIGCFLVFRPLTSETRAEIVTLALAAVAGEYGLSVRHVEPSVIIAILEQTLTDDFGARPYEYAVDELLGDCFAKAAGAFSSFPVEVRGGPPFECIGCGEVKPAPIRAE